MGYDGVKEFRLYPVGKVLVILPKGLYHFSGSQGYKHDGDRCGKVAGYRILEGGKGPTPPA